MLTGETVLIFQYGSNCLDSEINGKDRLNGDAHFMSIAETVDEYEMAFDVFSNRRHCAAADIVRKPGDRVWGVLYRIPEYLLSRRTAGDRKSLDAIEGEGTNYERREILVRKPDGEVVAAVTYTVRNPRAGLTTNLDYVRFIITGLREHRIPRAYIEKVRAIAIANNPCLAASLERI